MERGDSTIDWWKIKKRQKVLIFIEVHYICMYKKDYGMMTLQVFISMNSISSNGLPLSFVLGGVIYL